LESVSSGNDSFHRDAEALNGDVRMLERLQKQLALEEKRKDAIMLQINKGQGVLIAENKHMLAKQQHFKEKGSNNVKRVAQVQRNRDALMAQKQASVHAHQKNVEMILNGSIEVDNISWLAKTRQLTDNKALLAKRLADREARFEKEEAKRAARAAYRTKVLHDKMQDNVARRKLLEDRMQRKQESVAAAQARKEQQLASKKLETRLKLAQRREDSIRIQQSHQHAKERERERQEQQHREYVETKKLRAALGRTQKETNKAALKVRESARLRPPHSTPPPLATHHPRHPRHSPHSSQPPSPLTTLVTATLATHHTRHSHPRHSPPTPPSPPSPPSPHSSHPPHSPHSLPSPALPPLQSFNSCSTCTRTRRRSSNDSSHRAPALTRSRRPLTALVP
jgi:hypothetical protein